HGVPGHPHRGVQPAFGHRRRLVEPASASPVQELGSADPVFSTIDCGTSMTKVAPVLSAAEAMPKGVSLWDDAWVRLRKNRLAMFGMFFLIFIIIACVAGPWLSPYGYEEQNLRLGAIGPSAAHWFGTDPFGRDLLTRVLYGGRISLAVGFVATAVALVIGVTYGAVAGYVGGRADAIMMRLVDILYALPFMIFIILLMVVFGRNLVLLFLAIGAVEWLTLARIVRGQVQSLRQQESVEAAIALGLSTPAILRTYLIPNALGPVIVYTTLTIPNVMLLEAFLSFLGLGIQPPQSSW